MLLYFNNVSAGDSLWDLYGCESISSTYHPFFVFVTMSHGSPSWLQTLYYERVVCGTYFDTAQTTQVGDNDVVELTPPQGAVHALLNQSNLPWDMMLVNRDAQAFIYATHLTRITRRAVDVPDPFRSLYWVMMLSEGVLVDDEKFATLVAQPEYRQLRTPHIPSIIDACEKGKKISYWPCCITRIRTFMG